MCKTSTNIKHNQKTKVTELEQIFRIIDDNPYFELKYKKVGDDYYHVGYSSYDFHDVLQWERECFELANCIECKSDQKDYIGRKCQSCVNKSMFEHI